MSARAYPPVVAFKIESRADTVRGYAAPLSGPSPCVVTLTSGGETIMAVRAGRFSEAAASAGHRYGWCGFEMPGLAQAFALDDKVELWCGATGKVLCALAYNSSVFSLRHSQADQPGPLEVRALATRALSCSDVTLLLPFAEAFIRAHGPSAFIQATFQSFLARQADADDFDEALSILEEDDGLEHLLVSLWDARESGLGSDIPGPFHPAFPYDKAFLR